MSFYVCIIQSILKLTTIKTLKLNGLIDLFEPDILQMTNNLQLLEEFCVKTRAKISGFGIKELLQRSSDIESSEEDDEDDNDNKFSSSEFSKIVVFLIVIRCKCINLDSPPDMNYM